MTFVYRGDFLMLQLATVLVPVISLLVWRAAVAAGADLPVDQDYLDSYFLAVSVVSMATASWTAPFLSTSIRNGELSRSLLRPASPHLDGYANNLGEKVVKLALLVPIIVVVVLVLPETPRVVGDPRHWALAVVAVVVAAVIAHCFEIACASLAFWFSDVNGFLVALELIKGVLSGAVVPLVLMPPALATALSWQPFRFFVSFPIEVATGQVAGGVAFGFAQQLGWLLVVGGLSVLLWRTGLRRYAASGA